MFDRYAKQQQDGSLPPTSPVMHQSGYRGSSSHSRHKSGRHSNGRSSGMRMTAENALSNSLPTQSPSNSNGRNTQLFRESGKRDNNHFLVDINQREAANPGREKLGSRKGTASGRRQLGDGNGYLRNNFNRGLNMSGNASPSPTVGQQQRNGRTGSQRQLNGTQRQQRNTRASKLPQIQAGARGPVAGNKVVANNSGAGGREWQKVSEQTQQAGVCSITGLKPDNPNWVNQDNFICLEQRSGHVDEAMYCVLDGHGQQGHVVSTRCRERMPQLYRESGNNLSQTCLRMQAELDKSGIDVKCSGATCVICVIQGRALMVGNLGDSKAVLGRRVNGVIMPQPLTNDHKPDRPDERQRILQAGGKVGCRQLVVGNGPNGPVRLPMGPMRIWYQVRGETMGLAMSRSLGDSIVHTQGVSADPELTEHVIDGDDVFLVLGSDGIWDVTDLNQAIQIVQSVINKNPHGWDPTEAADMLATSARRRWESMSQMIDDITAIVVKLQ